MIASVYIRRHGRVTGTTLTKIHHHRTPIASRNNKIKAAGQQDSRRGRERGSDDETMFRRLCPRPKRRETRRLGHRYVF